MPVLNSSGIEAAASRFGAAWDTLRREIVVASVQGIPAMQQILVLPRHDAEVFPTPTFRADRVAFLYQGAVHTVATPAELKASPDPIVQQFIQGRSAGPMETPGF